MNLKLQQTCSLLRTRIGSSIGNGAKDIFVDFQPVAQSSPARSDTYVTLVAASQSQNAGVAQPVGIFLCSPQMNEGGADSNILASDGGISENMIGTFLNSDSSSGFNWGNIFPSVLGMSPMPIPPGWFFRFATFLHGSLGFPLAGAKFQIDVTYFLSKRGE